MTERRFPPPPIGRKKQPLATPGKSKLPSVSHPRTADPKSYAGHLNVEIGYDLDALNVEVFQTDAITDQSSIDYLVQTKPIARDMQISYEEIFRSSYVIQADIVKQGIAPRYLKRVAEDLRLDQTTLVNHLGLVRSTYSRKLRDGDPLNLNDSERLLGMMRLVGQVQLMVEQSGDPDGFNASEWVGQWIEQPLPALGGKAPADYMDTAAGQELISQLLRQAQSGAYA
ncbi:antitoxin Xre/MbcA/ParS toxin-binding domain-containing protein [Dyella silvatica]|uniref:antitoxin Xre/MbcA/ParS toxin-binding domain-containing protein n=1 Tax=Dyella silvatica TaxID=2992128 RepID=UPI00225A052F|nr:antitoxin Xre/MbcA/ParS toxin-binding domain-containing protein [Dyella silvatica]